jgi:hypothetical protein
MTVSKIYEGRPLGTERRVIDNPDPEDVEILDEFLAGMRDDLAREAAVAGLLRPLDERSASDIIKFDE